MKSKTPQQKKVLTEHVLALTITELRSFMVKTFPTKDDVADIVEEKLENYPTRGDLRGVKEDLQNDLKNQLKAYATKEDVTDLAEHVVSVLQEDINDSAKKLKDHDKRIVVLESGKN